MRNRRTLIMAEVSMMTAAAIILDLLTFLRFWPQGGSVSLAMVPVLLIAFRRGWKVGLVTGFLYGIGNMIYNPFIVHWLQALLDYPIAFMLLGAAGIVPLFKQSAKWLTALWLLAGTLLAAALRFAAHFTAGVVWFGDMAPEGTPVEVYAFFYNLSYILPSAGVSAAVLILLYFAAPRLFNPDSR